jgi:hypothetical protein
MAFSLRSVPTYYKQDKFGVIWMVGELVGWLEDVCCSVFVGCCCEKLVAEARNSSENQQRLVKAERIRKTSYIL